MKKKYTNFNKSYFIPVNNLYLDEALKGLKANEFKTYMALTYIVKLIGPNTKLYYSNKKEIFQETQKLINISERTFLKHIKIFEYCGLIEFERSNALNIGYNISDSKSYGFTAVDIDELKYLITNLDQNELKLYMTIYRLLRGFNKEKARYTYAQLKTWSGIKNKATFISSRNSLVQKKLISALYDLDKNTFTFKLSEINLDQIDTALIEKEEKELRQEDLKPSINTPTEEKKPHIKKSSTFLNKYFKKSCSENSKSKYQNKAQDYQKQNKNKILKFLNENIQTNHLPKAEKFELVDKLILEVKNSGGFKGVKIKSTPDYYLAQEHETYGRNLDKIVEKYFENIEKIKRDHQACQQFIDVVKRYYPEKVSGLEDFRLNDISYHKLGKLISKSPILHFWTDENIIKNKQIKNPDYDSSLEQKSQEYMNKLIESEIGHNKLDFDERMSLVESLLPKVNLEFPLQDEYLIEKKCIDYNKFKNDFSYKESRIVDSSK